MKQSMALLTSSESVEWYTPVRIINFARWFMGSIDLDPATTEQANTVVGAKIIYTQQDNGLQQPWYGNVWLNSPYGKTNQKSNQQIWYEYAMTQPIYQMCMLINSRQGYTWYENICDSHPHVLIRDRLNFIPGDGQKSGQAKTGSTLVYVGPHKERFKKHAQVFGRVY